MAIAASALLAIVGACSSDTDTGARAGAGGSGGGASGNAGGLAGRDTSGGGGQAVTGGGGGAVTGGAAGNGNGGAAGSGGNTAGRDSGVASVDTSDASFSDVASSTNDGSALSDASQADTGRAASADGGAHTDAGTSVTPPVTDKSSTVPLSSSIPSGYKIDGNIAYGKLVKQRIDVIYPTNEGPKGTTLRPGVIMFHGGGWINPGKDRMSSFTNRFLSHGFVVCNAEYRLADGTADGGPAPAAVEDALLAAKWCWDHLDYYHVDRNRYVVTGASAGGHLALMVGMATADAKAGPVNPTDFKIAAIVNGYGPSDVGDLLDRGTDFALQWVPTNLPNRADLIKRMSPITYVRKDIPPLLTVHGSKDTTVPVAQSEALDKALKAAGADASLHIVEGAAHGFTDATWPDAETAMFDFLKSHKISD